MLIRFHFLVVTLCLALCWWYTQSHPLYALPFAIGAMGWGLMLAALLNRRIAEGRSKLWHWFSAWCMTRAFFTPYKHINGYMLRYWLCRIGTDPDSREGQRYPRYGIRVHQTVSSDVGHFHDHAWPSVSLILLGGYWDVQPILDHTNRVVGSTRTWCGPGKLIFRRAGTWHRLELASGKKCLSLFAMGRKRQDWGFLVNGRKVPWREYLGVPAESATV